MRGRKAKPTKLKLLEGNPGKKKINKNEPEPDVCIPEMPEWMSDEAKREYMIITPLLKTLGLISKVDKAAIVGYCEAWSHFKDAKALIKKEGLIYVTE